ncbi:MAG: methylenetetrahydrofolate reductase [Nitrospinota bacterium]|nr:methylenetetrahydrofolate reductase [Nitrospinota bacterium]
MDSKLIKVISDPSTSISIEFYPPKDEDSRFHLLKETKKISTLIDVSFFSVTYGAGGSTQAGTLELVTKLSQIYEERVVSHLTCIGATRSDLTELIKIYKENNMFHILAIRGDIPEDFSKDKLVSSDFKYAIDLLKWLRDIGGFSSIGVACYPEGHPETPDFEKDLEYFSEKIYAGADYAISQFFFESNVWESFLERCSRKNITIPLIPGVLPIRDIDQTIRFAKRCGANVPDGIANKLLKYKNDPTGFNELSAEMTSQLIISLEGLGSKHFHIYSLNRSNLIKLISDRLGWKKAN